MMMFPCVLLLFLFLLKEDKPFIDWEVCDGKEYLLHELKVDLNPKEPHRGKSIQAHILAELDARIVPGEFTAEYKISYGLLVIRQRKVDVCGALEEAAKWIEDVPQCPISAGKQEISIVGKIPLETPMGKYSMTLQAYRNNDTKPLLCINARAYLGLT